MNGVRVYVIVRWYVDINDHYEIYKDLYFSTKDKAKKYLLDNNLTSADYEILELDLVN